MELRQLQYFLAVIEAGTLSRAAIALAISQPVLSRQIKALEDEMGSPLLHRTGRGVVPSEAGRVLEQHARKVIEEVSEATVGIRALSQAPNERVVLGMPPSLAAVLTTPLVQQFRNELPEASLGIVEAFSGHMLEWLMSGLVDVAVLYNAPRLRTLATDPLVTDEIFLLGPASDPARVGVGPVPATRLAELPMILPTRPHGLRVLLDQVLAKAGLAARAQLEINAMPSTLSLVEAGVGYTILSYSCVHQQVAAQRIRCWRIAPPTLTRSLVMATSTQRPVTQVARRLMRMVHRQIDGIVENGQWAPAQI
jgi:LysR family transcriptional regulator, nitrogen assimilation regulatory protein